MTSPYVGTATAVTWWRSCSTGPRRTTRCPRRWPGARRRDARGGRRRRRTRRRALVELGQGVLRRGRPQGAQRASATPTCCAQRPHFRARVHGRARPAGADHRGRARVRARRRVRVRAVLRPDRVRRDAVLGLPEVTVGVIPGGGGTQLLTRRIGSVAGRRPDLHRAAHRRRRGPAPRAGRPAGRGRARTARRRSSWPRRSPPTRPSACATPSGRCGSGSTSTWPAASRSRTPPGGRRRSRPTGPRAWRRSTRSAAPTGRDDDDSSRCCDFVDSPTPDTPHDWCVGVHK